MLMLLLLLLLLLVLVFLVLLLVTLFVRYNGSVQRTPIRLQPSGSTRVGVCVDRPAGTLSFYRVSPGGGRSSDTLTHIHTFQLTSTQEDLLPGFGLYRWYGSSATLSRL